MTRELYSNLCSGSWRKILKIRAKCGRQRPDEPVIEVAEEFRPDIAMLDIQMPGINGIEAIEEIKTFCPRTCFIIMSRL